MFSKIFHSLSSSCCDLFEGGWRDRGVFWLFLFFDVCWCFFWGGVLVFGNVFVSKVSMACRWFGYKTDHPLFSRWFDSNACLVVRARAFSPLFLLFCNVDTLLQNSNKVPVTSFAHKGLCGDVDTPMVQSVTKNPPGLQVCCKQSLSQASSAHGLLSCMFSSDSFDRRFHASIFIFTFENQSSSLLWKLFKESYK